jgi:uncharacterized protein YjbJ (UPF0337 family)
MSARARQKSRLRQDEGRCQRHDRQETNNKKMQVEGKVDKAKGAAEQAKGDVKYALKKHHQETP